MACPLTRPIERCLERNPDRRYAGVDRVIGELEAVTQELTREDLDDAPPVFKTMRFGDPDARVSAVYDARADPSVTRELIGEVSAALDRLGYELRRAMGRVKEHAIFMAAPNHELVAQGQFHDSNTYPKIVTVMSLAGEEDPALVVDIWLGTYLPILRAARQGLLTSLYRVVYDEPTQFLMLFSEYVDDARFGTALEDCDLSLEEALGLAYLVARQVRRLHTRGMAHNNVTANALMLKGLRESRRVHPAMVGIVSPTLEPDDMIQDVRRLANMALSWVRPERIEEAEAVHHSRLGDVYRRIDETASGKDEYSCTIDEFLEAIADGLSAIDFNWGVLRENGGDLDAYALLLVSHALYGRLWK